MRNVCPVTWPATPPANSPVNSARVASVVAVTAIIMPYHFRSGTNQCCPVTVTIGVTVSVRISSTIDPVPRTSASTLSRVLLFSSAIAREMKTTGISAGMPSRQSATVFLLIAEPPNLKL